jgi:hypothetical protein
MHFLSQWYNKKDKVIAASRATNVIIPDRTPEVTSYLHLGISNDKMFLLFDLISIIRLCLQYLLLQYLTNMFWVLFFTG